MNRFWKFLLKPSTWITKLLLALFVALFFSLEFLVYLEPIKTFLDSDSLAFHVGELRFSVYSLIKALLTLVILFWLAGILSQFGENRIKALRGIKTSNKALMVKALQVGAYFLVIITGLDVLGIDLTALAIFSGAVGIGIGIGLQKITSNFISGLILLLEKSMENNDLLELSDGTYGLVRHTGARYTLIETFDGKEIMIPNEDFITQRLINWTYTNTKGRVDIAIGVSYDSDIEKARDLMLEAAREHPRCIATPEPVCFLREFADSSVNFLMFFWVADVTQGRYEPQSDVLRSIWKKFKQHQIAIPYPQRDLHIKNPEALKWTD